MNEHLYRLYRQNLRRNTTVKEYRQMHKLERALIIWPLHAYMWVNAEELNRHQSNRLRAVFLCQKTRTHGR